MTTLTGHTTRVLYMTIAPDGENVCTGAGDETLRFWSLFGKGAEKARARLDDGAAEYLGVEGGGGNFLPYSSVKSPLAGVVR